MTFFEAAIEVLRTVQRPLDYKAITQFAISRQLLGHVGRTPELVMASCLMRAVQRCDTGALIRLDSGDFALRGWSEEILARTDEPTLPQSVASVDFPPVNLGLLDETESIPLLENDDIQFRKAVQLKFESAFTSEDDKQDIDWDTELAEKTQFEEVRQNLNAQHNEHYNLCAAIVKTLRNDPTPMRSALIASAMSQKMGNAVYEQSVVLAMRADNALRVSRGKRAVFMHIPPDMWTLTENFLARHILKLESKLYDMSRQLRIYSIHALSIKLRELSSQAWLQLATIILKHLSYTMISQCRECDNSHIFRAEEARGLTYIPVIIKIIHTPLVTTEDVLQFRELIREFGYDHGVLMSNGDVSRDALNECTAREYPIYAYSARQIAPIMLDARIGVTPNELPIVFIDNNFFQELSAKDVKADVPEVAENEMFATQPLALHAPCEMPEIPDIVEDMDAYDVDMGSGEYIFDENIDISDEK